MTARDRVLIRAADLAARLGEAHPPVVLDALVVRHEDPGVARWRSGARESADRRIPGARHADLVHALSGSAAGLDFVVPAPDAAVAALADLGVGAGSSVVVYDRDGGSWAARLWYLLRWLGHDDVRVLDGGLTAWVAAGLPTESGAPVAAQAPVVPITPRLRHERFVGLDEVTAIVDGRADGVLVCALPPGIHLGEVELYGRAGHIAGSRNVPASTVLDERHVADDATLLASFADIVATGAPIVLYCGSGVSAAVDALGLAILGIDDVAVYDGSLQEWGGIAGRPLAVAARDDAEAHR